jgi:hypothetical protein
MQYLGDFLKRTALVVVHGGMNRLLASPQRGEVGGGNAWTVSSPVHRRLRDQPHRQAGLGELEFRNRLTPHWSGAAPGSATLSPAYVKT